jgi:PhnB protein
MVDQREDFHTITPQIVVSNGAAAIDLYKKAFGAEELVRLPVEGSSKIFHACLRIGDSRIHLADENQAAGLVAPKDASGGSRFLLYVEDADHAHRVAVAAGMAATAPPEDKFWGDRMGVVADRFGHTWMLASPVKQAEVVRNDWAVLLHHRADGILELRWLPAAMTDAAFKATLALLASEAEKVRPPFVLVDATDFRHQPGPGIMQWRDDVVMPRYGAAGIKKFAFHMPKGVPGTIESGGKEKIEGPAVFPTAWFSERQHALDWFKRA